MKSFATLMLASMAAATLQEEVTHPTNSFWSAAGSDSSKMIGRIGWNNFFDRWVNALLPSRVDPDHHPCAFEFQFA